MTKKQKNELVLKFLKWLSTKRCEATVETVKTNRKTIKTCTITQYANGAPANTICYETFSSELSDNECWLQLLKRKCDGQLIFDRFDIFGLRKTDSLPELELMLEITMN